MGPVRFGGDAGLAAKASDGAVHRGLRTMSGRLEAPKAPQAFRSGS